MIDNNADQAVAAKDLENLKARAAQMNIRHHPNIGAAKLAEKIQEALDSEAPTTDPTAAIAPITQAETRAQKVLRKRQEAALLVRVRVTCMNTAKREWSGEIFTAGNSLVGSFTKFVPFNNEAGWHVPQIILNMMEERMCQVFTAKGGKGRDAKVKVGKLIKEFAIEIMTPLTPAQIKDLATQQAIAHSID